MKKILPLLLATALLITSCGKELISNSDYVTSTPTAINNTFAGSGVQGSVNGTGTSASFYLPTGVAVDVSENVYVADYGNNLVREISPAGVVITLAGSGLQGSANGTGTAASFYQPSSVAVDASYNIYVADRGNNLIRKITPSGVVTTLAGSGSKGSANGTGTGAAFNQPTGVAVDASGNVYVADYGNNLIRKITPSGVVTTLAGGSAAGSANGTGIAASFYLPTAVAVDASGNVYVTDCGNNLVREISPAGVVTTLAGSGIPGAVNGTGTAASFNGLSGIAVDPFNNIYVADYNNSLIREINQAGIVTTLSSNSGSNPYGIAIDTEDNIYVAEYTGNTILKISN